jgi:DNA-binding PadR family transcriptional regulator
MLWYSRKPPTLQISILNRLALYGPLSKSKVKTRLNEEGQKANYPDVSDAIKVLDKRRLVTFAYADFKRPGKPERYYKLTARGLEAYIEEVNTPEEFWKAMIQFCRLDSAKTSAQDLDRFYRIFESLYIGFSSETRYFYQSHFLDKLFSKWLRDNGKIGENGKTIRLTESFKDYIPVSQKVLECLALSGPSTLKHLVSEVNMEERRYREAHLFSPFQSWERLDKALDAKFGAISTPDNIKDILRNYTLSEEYLKQITGQEQNQNANISDRYLDFLNHSLIAEKKGIYELTLFGITLVLFIVNYVNKSNPYLPLPLPKLKFSFHRTSDEFIKYYDVIASHYRDRLPLIFGNWDMLKNALADSESEPLARIVNVLFTQEARKELITRSTVIGGFKEYNDCFQALSHHANKKLKEIYEALKENEENNIESKLRVVFDHKMNEIHYDMMFTHIDDFIDMLYEKLIEDSNNANDILKRLEFVYANEVSFLFYLCAGGDLAMVTRNIGVRFMDSLDRRDVTYNLEPSATLTTILESDEVIKTRFSALINDSIAYQKKVFDLMHKYNISIRGNKRICLHCGKVNHIHLKTCKGCRSKLKVTCERCGHISPYGSCFCNKCGFGL